MGKRIGSRSNMGMNWDRLRARDIGRQSHYAEVAAEAALRRSQRPLVSISKAAARAQADQALQQYDGRVLRAIVCQHCGHSGKARIPIDSNPRFRCSNCNAITEA